MEVDAFRIFTDKVHFVLSLAYIILEVSVGN